MHYHSEDDKSNDQLQQPQRQIFDSKTYHDAEPYSSTEEKIRLDNDHADATGIPFNLTLTVYDTARDGFELEGGNFYYQINRTLYEFSHDSDLDEGDRWVTHQTNIATIHGQFYKNNYILTRNTWTNQEGEPLYQQDLGQKSHNYQQQQEIQISELNAGENALDNYDYDQFGNKHHHGYFNSLVINAVVILIVIVFGINVFISVNMYRTRQRGTGVEALDEENRAFLQLYPRRQRHQTRGEKQRCVEGERRLTTRDISDIHIPHYVTVELGEVHFDNESFQR